MLFSTARQLRSASELTDLKSKGKAGAPVRMAVRVEGTFGAGCACPPFTAWFSGPGTDESAQSILAVPRNGVADPVTTRMNLSFIVVGYFSGAAIDTYEYFRATGVDSPTPDEEEQHTWRDVHPEFCLEAWCYWTRTYAVNSEAGSDGTEDYASFLRGISLEHAASLAMQGIPKCKREWMRDLP